MEIKIIKSTAQDSTRVLVKDFPAPNNVPVWKVETPEGLIKLVGYAKFINQAYGKVLFRGQTALYPTMYPSAYRPSKETPERTKKQIDNELHQKLQVIASDNRLDDYIHARQKHRENAFLIYESIMQHYEAQTRFLDLVDRIDTALWFASHKCKDHTYTESKEDYSYLLLVGIEKPYCSRHGVEISDSGILIDLRQALPSTILRPHAQHAMVYAGRNDDASFAEDLSKQVISVIQIETKKCLQWLGNGELFNVESIFPDKYDDFRLNILGTKEDFVTQLGLYAGIHGYSEVGSE